MSDLNSAQFTTFAEALAVSKQLSSFGGGVKPLTDDNDTTGIYIPEFQMFPSTIGDAKFYHFRFVNGAEGFNAGLIRNLMKTNPSRWALMLAAEINSAV